MSTGRGVSVYPIRKVTFAAKTSERKVIQYNNESTLDANDDPVSAAVITLLYSVNTVWETKMWRELRLKRNSLE
jgi:hypothetical protein